MRDIPVRCPFPHVSCHIKQTIAVWFKGTNGRSAFVFIYQQVLVREFSLPSIGFGFSKLCIFIPPGKIHSVQSPSCSKLPFSFSGQFFTFPFRIGFRILKSDVNYRMVLQSNYGAARSLWVLPAR